MEEDYDFYLDEDVQIILQWNEHKYILALDCIVFLLKTFQGYLEVVLNKKLFLHKSIDKNIGFMFNKILQNNVVSWEGNKNLFLSAPGYARPKVSTWIYNDKESDHIILEIAENYLWTFMEPEEGKKFIEYEEFIKDYTS